MHPSVHARVVFVSGAALVQPCVLIVSLFDAPLALALPATKILYWLLQLNFLFLFPMDPAHVSLFVSFVTSLIIQHQSSIIDEQA